MNDPARSSKTSVLVSHGPSPVVLHAAMTAFQKLAGRPIERFTPHDFRRTARSNTKRLNVDYDTAEAMMNHLK
jgi:integrase